MMIVWVVLAVLVVGLSRTRKARAFMWTAQIALGDAIAWRKGTFIHRYFKKRALRVLTKPTRIWKFKRK